MKNYSVSKLILLLSFVLLIFHESRAQDDYRIAVTVAGSTDTALVMTCYYGDKIKLVDTATRVKKGKFVFEGKKKLPGGIYMAVTPGKVKLFEFIVGDDQHFEMKTDTSGSALNLEAFDSEENQVFIQFMSDNERTYKKVRALIDQIDSTDLKSDANNAIRAQVDSINKKATQAKLQIIEQYPDLFVGKLLNAMRDVKVPDSVLNSSDSTQAYKYYKTHFWDHFDLQDSCLIRTPVIANKLNEYFEKAVYLQPDSVIAAIDVVIAKARPSREMVGYLMWYFMAEYQNPKYMGFDKILVHLYDRYFSQEQILFTSESVLKMIKERVDVLRPLLIGKVAPNMILMDTTEQLKALYSIKSEYTLILFWDYNCGHCKVEIDALKPLYDAKTYPIEVYAVCVDSDMDKWKKAIRERELNWINVNGTRSATPDFHGLYDIHGTPVMFLLDKDKRIVGKQIVTEQIPELLKHLEKKK